MRGFLQFLGMHVCASMCINDKRNTHVFIIMHIHTYVCKIKVSKDFVVVHCDGSFNNWVDVV